MQPNPYSPPKAELADQPKPPGSPVKAVVLGLVVDVGGSVLAGGVLGMIYAFTLVKAGMDLTQIDGALRDIPPYSWMSVAGITIGAATSVLGGFTCARVSRRRDYKLGFILGAISATTGLLLSFGSHSLSTSALLFGLTFAAVLLGTKLGIAKSEV